MVETFLLSPFMVDYTLPFILVFALMFAILQKTKLLGDEAKRVNAMIALVIGLMLVAFPPARTLVVLLMPFLAVFAVLLLVFMLLYGFIVGKKEGDVLGRPWKIAFGGILALSLVSYLLMVSGYWDIVWSLFFAGGRNQLLMTVIMIAAIVGVIAAVIWGDKK
ncbi:MAG: hypothetical protein RL557_853 [archaeon]|jgi:hypothetical protein